jgi:hypothetical protein
MRPAHHLSVVKEPAPDAGARLDPTPDLGDLVLIGVLFVLNLMPVAGELARIGRWSPGIVGFAAAAALLTGRELWSQLRARARARR